MIPFQFETPDNIGRASTALADGAVALAGGTTVVDLMKLNLLTAERVVSVKPLLEDSVSVDGDTLRVGAGCTMSDLASNAEFAKRFPAARQSLILAASPQIRNMATLGGNLLQRTRSPYFRHNDMPVEGPPNLPNSDGQPDPSLLAVLGRQGRFVGTYPGDFAVVFVAFEGELELSGPDGERTVAARDFYVLPKEGEHQYSTRLKPGEIITALRLPLGAVTENSLYLKVRERSSYAFALSSAAVGLEMDGKTIKAAHVGLGGLGSVPWASPEAEKALVGNAASDDTFSAAAEAALKDADPPAGAEFKVPLAKRTIVRALKRLRDDGPPSDERLWAMQHGRG